MDNHFITVFEGSVNGTKFNNRTEMEAYIGQLMTQGKEITEMSFNTTRKAPGYKPMGPAPITGPFLCIREQVELEKPVEITQDFFSYLIPFVEESVFVRDSSTHRIGLEGMLNDCEKKLKRRMDLFAALVVPKMKDSRFSKDEMRTILLTLRDQYNAKLSWCRNRKEVYESLIDLGISNGNEGLVNLDACRMGSAVYEMTAGFCGAMIDILKDHINTL